MRLVIVGAPRSGKTTYAVSRAQRENVPAYHTDDLIGVHDWSGVSEVVARAWFARPGPWIVEGVAAVRALRKWLAENPEGRPCDLVVNMRSPRLTLTPGQARMAKACETIWLEIAGELRRRGVEIGVE